MRKQETKYQKLSNWIKQKIETGEWKSGQKLYSENELSEMFELSRQTVRHAIHVLEEEGLVERVRGSGTYWQAERTDPQKMYEHCGDQYLCGQLHFPVNHSGDRADLVGSWIYGPDGIYQ